MQILRLFIIGLIIATTSMGTVQAKPKKGRVVWDNFTQEVDAAVDATSATKGIWSTSEKQYISYAEFLEAVATKKIILIGSGEGRPSATRSAFLLEDLIKKNGPYALMMGKLNNDNVDMIDKGEVILKGRMKQLSTHINKKLKKHKGHLNSSINPQEALFQVRYDRKLPLYGLYVYDAATLSPYFKDMPASIFNSEAQRYDKVLCHRANKQGIMKKVMRDNVFNGYLVERINAVKAQHKHIMVFEGYSAARKDQGPAAYDASIASEMVSIVIMPAYEDRTAKRGMGVADPFSQSSSMNGRPKYDYIWVSGVRPTAKPESNDCDRLKEMNFGTLRDPVPYFAKSDLKMD